MWESPCPVAVVGGRVLETGIEMALFKNAGNHSGIALLTTELLDDSIGGHSQ